MYKFGASAPRALNQFGVAGLLADPCKVFYESIFTIRHIGRVADLLNARLKPQGLDELRFRIVLMFTLHEAYHSQLTALGVGGTELLPEPIVIECGVDDEKVAIGLAFTYSSQDFSDVNLAALSARISSGGAQTRLERLIAQISMDADQAVVRIEPKARRIEVLSLLALPDKIALTDERRPLEIVFLTADVKATAVKADYTELGDLDYAELLKSDRAGHSTENSGTGEYFVKALLESEDESTRISSVTENTTDAQIKISGKKVDHSIGGELLAQLSQRHKHQDAVPGDAALVESPVTSELSPDSSSSVPEPDAQDGATWMEKVWPFKSAQNEAEVKPEMKSEPSSHSDVDATRRELLLEKAHLVDAKRKLELSFRQKELEFRNKEAVFNENIHRKDEQIRHKNFALERAKEQIAQLMMIAERAKNIGISRARPALSADYKVLQDKYELLFKQAEEFKKANQQLMEDKLKAQPQAAAAPSVEQVKDKLAAAMRLAAKFQKESEQLRSKLQTANEAIVLLRKSNGTAENGGNDDQAA
jgi:hypothetical protein